MLAAKIVVPVGFLDYIVRRYWPCDRKVFRMAVWAIFRAAHPVRAAYAFACRLRKFGPFIFGRLAIEFLFHRFGTSSLAQIAHIPAASSSSRTSVRPHTLQFLNTGACFPLRAS